MLKNSAKIDAAKYARLGAKTLPKVIANDMVFDRMAAQPEALSFRGDPTPGEDALVGLSAKLVEGCDSPHYPPPSIPPRAMVEYPMDQRGLRQSYLLPIFGSRGIQGPLWHAQTGPETYLQTGGILRRAGRGVSISGETLAPTGKVAGCKRSSPVA